MSFRDHKTKIKICPSPDPSPVGEDDTPPHTSPHLALRPPNFEFALTPMENNTLLNTTSAGNKKKKIKNTPHTQYRPKAYLTAIFECLFKSYGRDVAPAFTKSSNRTEGVHKGSDGVEVHVDW